MKFRCAFAILGFVGLTVCASVQTSATERTPKEIQAALSQKGFNPGAVDGLWGKKSARALMEFQKSHGLPATGKIDDVTVSALFPEYPGLENGSLRASQVEIGKQPDPDAITLPSVEVQADQKTDRVAAEPVEAKSAADANEVEETPGDLSIRTEVKQKAVTPVAEVQADTDSRLPQPVENGDQPWAVYVAASVILGGLLLARRKRKAKAKPIWSPPPPDLAVAEGIPLKTRIPTQISRQSSEVIPVAKADRPSGIPTSPSADVITVDFERMDIKRPAPRELAPDNDTLTPIEERAVSVVKNETTLMAHTAAVKRWVTENAEASRLRFDESQRQQFGTRAEPDIISVASTGWLVRGSEVTVAGVRITGGLIYVARLRTR